MKGKTWAVVAVALAAGTAARGARADGPSGWAPNIYGTGGLVQIPIAKTEDYRQIGAHVHGGTDFLSYGVSYGLLDRVEIGLTQAEASRFNHLRLNRTSDLIANVKYAVIKESTALPGVAVGATDLFDGSSLGSSPYVVASKTLVVPTPLHKWSLSVHGGIGTGIYNDLPFAGAELGLGFPFTALTFGMPLSLIVDVVNGDPSGAARLAGPAGFGLEVGGVNRGHGTSLYGAANFKHRF